MGVGLGRVRRMGAVSIHQPGFSSERTADSGWSKRPECFVVGFLEQSYECAHRFDFAGRISRRQPSPLSATQLLGFAQRGQA